jgi:hypothetical protein
MPNDGTPNVRPEHTEHEAVPKAPLPLTGYVETLDACRRSDKHFDGPSYPKKPFRWGKFYDRSISTLTLISVAIAAWIYKGQLDEMRQTTLDTGKAANAAQEAARIAGEAESKAAGRFEMDERAYVVLSNTTWDPVRPAALSTFTVTTHWMNTGRTPALNFRTAVFIEVLDHQPTDFARWEKEADAGHQSGNVGASQVARNIKPITLTEKGITEIENGSLKLYVYGTCIYSDAFKNEHRTRFSFFYDPIAQFFDTSATGNYMD